MRRRMTRAGKSALIKILLLLIIVIAVTVGGLVFVRRKRLIEEKYENTILELQTRINAANRHIYCAATDLKAGTVLGADCLVETEVLSDRWGYITEEDFGKVLFVDWSYQRRGYGRMLMEYWENDMRSQGYGMAMTSTQVDENAQHFYRKLGYKDCGGFTLDIPGFEQPMEMFMSKGI